MDVDIYLHYLVDVLRSSIRLTRYRPCFDQNCNLVCLAQDVYRLLGVLQPAAEPLASMFKVIYRKTYGSQHKKYLAIIIKEIETQPHKWLGYARPETCAIASLVLIDSSLGISALCALYAL